MTTSIAQRIADQLAVPERQISAAITLLDEGATVPFISRYRKEVTGGLDDTQMRFLDERLRYLRELEDRRGVILKSVEEQGKLTPTLEAALLQADTKNRLEDLYLPYKVKRRTKAQIAREAGLGPLAEALMANPGLDPETEAAAYLNADAGITDTKGALDGARQILMEHFAEDADLLARLRQFLQDHALLAARLVTGKEQEAAKFQDYFEHTEALARIPSHRALAMFRGRNEGVLNLSLTLPDQDGQSGVHPCEVMVREHWGIHDQG
ncbi:MAG TPA: Tex-like N-terminal domain-containing protein, partial [Kineobactrum sp.]